MRNIRFIVPRSRTRVVSKVSLRESARALELRISSPIATVSCHKSQRRCDHQDESKVTYILQHLHLCRYPGDVFIVLGFERIQHGVRIVTPKAPPISIYSFRINLPQSSETQLNLRHQAAGTTYLEFGVAARYPVLPELIPPFIYPSLIDPEYPP